jgi:hypothetical protein
MLSNSVLTTGLIMEALASATLAEPKTAGGYGL